jgi:hypothetical protein
MGGIIMGTLGGAYSAEGDRFLGIWDSLVVEDYSRFGCEPSFNLIEFFVDKIGLWSIMVMMVDL